jgi:hypothetical protein
MRRFLVCVLVATFGAAISAPVAVAQNSAADTKALTTETQGTKQAEASSATTTTTTTTTAAVSTSAPVLTEETLKQVRARGYKQRVRNGKSVYCRNEKSIGSRFEETVCIPESEIAAVLKLEQQRQSEIARNRGRNCTGDGCVQN